MIDDSDTEGHGPQHGSPELPADEIQFLENARSSQKRFAEKWLAGISPATEPATVLLIAKQND